ncbi:MAG TPA: sigma-70 family RNA polymerase sigma factor [Solirubrobacterales bacterium]|nr:sigma-70 family RNA polymerase sigma factor [Solirubrobacterales bacterium]
MEASALTHAGRRGLLVRRSPLLKLQGDEKLIAMARNGNPGAFETIVDRYQGRLLGFCRQMLGSTEDAEDVLQEVFVNAYRAMLADEREINLRPWLYRIARNRCLNYLRKPKAEAQESMDMVPEVDAASTAEKVHNREEFRQILCDVNKLPETQRAALLLREMDALSYEEIAAAMDTTVPSVKSLLVRARISLTEASQARLLTCGEVRIELSEAAEGLRKASAPVRRHVRECDECADFRSQLRSNEKALAALFPVGPLIAFKGFVLGKLGLGGAGGAGAGASASGAGAASAGAGAMSVGGAAAALGGSSAASGLGAIGGALGTKAVAGVVTAAVLTAGAVEVKQHANPNPVGPATSPQANVREQHPTAYLSSAQTAPIAHAKPASVEPVEAVEAPPVPAPTEAPAEVVPPPVAEEEGEAAGESAAGEEATVGDSDTEAITEAKPSEEVAGAHGGTGTVVVTVTPPPPAESTPPPSEPPPPPSESAPPLVEVSPPVVESPPAVE